MGGGGFKGMVFIRLIAFVTLIPFFAFREAGRVFGEDALYALFFMRGAKKGALPIAKRQERKG